MADVPARVSERIKSGLRKIRPVLISAKERDVNESDTALIVASVLSELLGYDRFMEITSEYAIRSTFCDLAIKIDGKPRLLIEVKAVGLDLKDNHVRQAVDYGANQGIDWVVLTNGIVWRAYRILFKKPIDHELVFEVNLADADLRSGVAVDRLYLLSREGISKKALATFHEEKQATSRFMLAAIIQSEPVLDVMRREIRRVSGGVRVESVELCEILRSEVLKRDVIEGDAASQCTDRVRRASNKQLRRAEGTASASPSDRSECEKGPRES